MASAFNVRSQNKTDLVPNSLVGNNDSKFISMTPNLGINFYDSVSTILASISWDGISTTNTNGFDILSPLNMNNNNINNVNTISSGTGFDLDLTSNDSIFLTGLNINERAQVVQLTDGINDAEIVLDMGTNTDQNPRITLSHFGQISTIYNNDSLNIESDQQTFITTGKALTIESINDNTSLYNPSGAVYIDKTSPFTGDGNIYAGNIYASNMYGQGGEPITFQGSINMNSNDIYAGNIYASNMYGQGGEPLTFQGSINMNSNDINNVATINGGSGTNLEIFSNQETLIQTSQTLTIRSVNNNTSLYNSSGAVYVDNSSPFTGDGNIYGKFNGNLNGTATTATNSTNVAITDTNTNALFYPTFVSNNTGNLPLNVDKTTSPLTYNPSTGTMSANAYNISTAPSTVNNAGRFGQIGLVYIGAVQVAITGSAVAQNLNFASLFNSTYKNYRITLTPTTQTSFTAYPSYALAGFLGTSVPTTGGLFGYELVSSAPTIISPIYSAQTTVLATTPLVFAVSCLTNRQVQFDILNVGYATTQSQSVQLNCKSVYNNPGITGVRDATLSSTALSGTTITGLIIQQTALSVGNDMTLEATIYGFNPI